MRSKFSCVRSSHDMCARAHAHSLEGTFLMTDVNGILQAMCARVCVFGWVWVFVCERETDRETERLTERARQRERAREKTQSKP